MGRDALGCAHANTRRTKRALLTKQLLHPQCGSARSGVTSCRRGATPNNFCGRSATLGPGCGPLMCFD